MIRYTCSKTDLENVTNNPELKTYFHFERYVYICLHVINPSLDGAKS